MNKRYKYPKNWNALRTIIIIRDKFSCSICGIKESHILSIKGLKRSLHVMHLDGNTYNNQYVLEGELFNNPNNNLASGCPECHKLYDRQWNGTIIVKYKKNHQIVDLTMNLSK
jgi:5-methylcytosine-specific restriction endonuclease McrA